MGEDSRELGLRMPNMTAGELLRQLGGLANGELRATRKKGAKGEDDRGV